jgi:hypothetical protein
MGGVQLYIPTMTNTGESKMIKAGAVLFIACTLAGWGGMIWDIMSRRDERAFARMECMSRTRHAQHVSPEEAFILCAKEER